MRNVALVSALVLALTGCGVVEQAGNVGVCADAVRIAAFTPDPADPQATVDRAHSAADELAGLAGKASGPAGEAINSLATSMRDTTVNDLTSAPTAWLKKKADEVGALSKACGL